MSARANNAVEAEVEIEDADRARRNAAGQYVKGYSGNPSGGNGSAPGVVAYIKGITNDCFEMVDLFVTVMRGDKLEGSEWVSGPKERMQAASELLDRAIGKPKQTIEETGDDTAKEVLVTMQRLLDKKDDSPAPEALQGAESNANPILVMKDQKHG